MNSKVAITLFCLSSVCFHSSVFANERELDLLQQAQSKISQGHLDAGVNELNLLAQNGQASAQFQLGELYSNGEHLLPDLKQAISWYQLAANQQHAEAMNTLGKHLADGVGVTADSLAAEKWLRAAAVLGDNQHQHDLAAFLDRPSMPLSKSEEASIWYLRAIEQGNTNSMASLGLNYMQGRGVPQDNAKAKQLLFAAAEQGVASAQNNLGLLYSKGPEELIDHEQAVYWFKLAAEQGLKQAVTNLGVMYENGFGVPFDEVEATRLYALASQLESSSLPALLESIGTPYDERFVPLTEQSDQDITQYRRRANSGDPVSMYMLAYILALPGQTQNIREAVKWYEQSAEYGLQAAMLNLGLLHMAGSGVPQNYSKGFSLIEKAAVNGSASAGLIRDAISPFMLKR